MQKKNKIKMLLLILLGLIFSMHSFIPHHHHFDSLFGHLQNETKEHSEEHHEDKTSHCHAFNESFVDDDSESVKVFSKEIKFFLYINDSDELEVFNFSQSEPPDYKKIKRRIHYPAKGYLRGPPSVLS